jgi:hypothetical protein
VWAISRTPSWVGMLGPTEAGYLGERESQALGAGDELEATKVDVGILAVASRCPGRLPEQAAAFVVADGLDVHSGLVGELADRQDLHGRRLAAVPTYGVKAPRMGPPDERSTAGAGEVDPAGLCRWSAKWLAPLQDIPVVESTTQSAADELLASDRLYFGEALFRRHRHNLDPASFVMEVAEQADERQHRPGPHVVGWRFVGRQAHDDEPTTWSQ